MSCFYKTGKVVIGIQSTMGKMTIQVMSGLSKEIFPIQILDD